MERFIVGAQKSTNQLKALLAKLLPAAGGAGGGGGSGSAVDFLLSEITDSLSQALASLRCGASAGAGALDTPPPPGQSSTGGGGRRSEPRRSGQRVRADGACRMTVLQNGVQDSYTWRKYGRKEILGARHARNYFKCSRNSCPARKHVQQSDADPSKLDITYFNAHTCDDPPPSSTSRIVPEPTINSSGGTQRRNTAGPVQVTTAPSAQRCIGQPSPFPPCLVPDLTMTAGANVPRTPGVLPPVADVVLAALSSTQCDPVPHDTTLLTLSTEEEQGELLLIPSPACSQSELLPTEVAKVEPHGPPVWMEDDMELGDERIAISDFTVPELYH